MLAIAAKRLKNPSSGPKAKDGRMIDGRRLCRQHQALARRLRARIVRRRILVRADGRDVHQACAGARRGAGDCLGAFRLHRVEALPALFIQDADQIDDGIGIAHRRLDRIRKSQIGLHGVDLADPAERLQVPGQFRTADRHPDPVAAWPAPALHGGRGNPSRRRR